MLHGDGFRKIKIIYTAFRKPPETEAFLCLSPESGIDSTCHSLYLTLTNQLIMRKTFFNDLLFAVLLLVFCFTTKDIQAQVKIGGDPKKAPESSAVLELDDQMRGFLLPRISTEAMLKIKEPADGLLIYNSTEKKIFIYHLGEAAWKPLQQAEASRLHEADSTGEWHFDTATKKVYLVRGLRRNDSIFYDTLTRKFVFADKRVSATGAAVDEQFPGKYYFKGTASQLVTDNEVYSNFPSLTLANIIYEIDNDPIAVANPGTAFYNGVRILSNILPTATQKIASLRTMNLQLNHTGADSLQASTGVVLNSFIDGAGYTGLFSGYQTNLSISSAASNDIGSVFGYRSNINRSPLSTGRIKGNVYGYFGTMNGFFDTLGVNRIDGSAYGIFLGNVTGALPKRNYAFYSNKGHNRFGDSVLITDQFFISPRAVLDINSPGAMIIPNGTTVQRPVDAVQAMLRFNNNLNAMEYYDGTTWKGIGTDTAEWKYDTTLKQIQLVRGYQRNDSIYYHTQRNQFLFTDRTTYTNSLGNDFSVADFNGKYTFKTTASNADNAGLSNPSNLYSVMEADNSTTSRVFTGINNVTLANPKRTLPLDVLTGFNTNTLNTARDSVFSQTGIGNSTIIGSGGYTEQVTGLNNSVSIRNTSTNNIGQIVGIRNVMIRNNAATGSVDGNLYGYFGTMGNFNARVNGSAYGIFLGSVSNAAGPRRNFAVYTNKGLNRLGDSVLVTDGAAITPRAVLDVNATSAMIVPTGTTAQRPAAAVTGMVRYNTDNGGRLETYNGSTWIGTINGGIGIDLVNLPANTGTTVSFAFNGATVGSAIILSPSTPLPAGIIIAWARVSAANTIEVRFENNNAGPVNAPSTGFNVKVIQ